MLRCSHEPPESISQEEIEQQSTEADLSAPKERAVQEEGSSSDRSEEESSDYE